MKLVRILAPVLLLSLIGCSKNINTKEAVQQAIVKYLTTKTTLSVSGMDVSVSNVEFKGDEAVALVAFKPKGSDAKMGMQMRYALEKKSGEWVVKGKGDSGSQHGGAAMPGMPIPESGMPPAADLPPNHPPMGAATPPGAKK